MDKEVETQGYFKSLGKITDKSGKKWKISDNFV